MLILWRVLPEALHTWFSHQFRSIKVEFKVWVTFKHLNLTFYNVVAWQEIPELLPQLQVSTVHAASATTSSVPPNSVNTSCHRLRLTLSLELGDDGVFSSVHGPAGRRRGQRWMRSTFLTIQVFVCRCVLCMRSVYSRMQARQWVSASKGMACTHTHTLSVGLQPCG